MYKEVLINVFFVTLRNNSVQKTKYTIKFVYKQCLILSTKINLNTDSFKNKGDKQNRLNLLWLA